jgi:hypothetical protein
MFIIRCYKFGLFQEPFVLVILSRSHARRMVGTALWLSGQQRQVCTGGVVGFTLSTGHEGP